MAKKKGDKEFISSAIVEVGSRGRGRPPVLTDAKRKEFLTALKAGNRIQVAARYVGVSPPVVEEWYRRGRGLDKDRPPTPFFRQLAEDIDQAIAHAEVHAVTMNRQHMREDPASVRWWLENHSEEWRQRHLVPPPSAPQVPPAPAIGHAQNVILVTPAQLERMGLEALTAQEDEDDVAARRARLVTDSASPST